MAAKPYIFEYKIRKFGVPKKLSDEEYVSYKHTILANNKSEAIKEGQKLLLKDEIALGHVLTYEEADGFFIGRVVSNDNVPLYNYHHFYAKPERMRVYKSPLTNDDYIQAYSEDIFIRLDAMRIPYQDTIYGIRIENGIDTFMLKINEASEEEAFVTLYHKNLYNTGSKNSRLPDYHVQTTGRFHPDDILSYMLKHENKYKANGVAVVCD